MNREVKISLAVVGFMLLTFCGVLYYKLQSQDADPAAVADGQSDDPTGATASDSSELPTVSHDAGSTQAATTNGGSTAEDHSPLVAAKDRYRYRNRAAAPPVDSAEATNASLPPADSASLGSSSAPSDPFGNDRYGSLRRKAAEGQPTPRHDGVDRATSEDRNDLRSDARANDAPADPFAKSDGATPPPPADSPLQTAEGVDLAPSPIPNADSQPEQEALPSGGLGATAADTQPPPIDAKAPRSIDLNEPYPPLAPASPSAVEASIEAEIPDATKSLKSQPKTVNASGGRYPAKQHQPLAGGEAGLADSPYARSATEPRRLLPESSAAHQPANAHGEAYSVARNDSYWTISEKVYGSGAYFKALQRHNREASRRTGLAVGDTILTPPASELERLYPELCPMPRARASGRGTLAGDSKGAVPPADVSREYVVQDGDTLFDIAKYELGKASRWNEIYDLNRDRLGDDLERLPPGTRLVMPPGGSPSPVTSRPHNPYRR